MGSSGKDEELRLGSPEQMPYAKVIKYPRQLSPSVESMRLKLEERVSMMLRACVVACPVSRLECIPRNVLAGSGGGIFGERSW